MPKVFPSFDPLGDGKSRLELIDYVGDDATVVRAARVSYANDEKIFDNEKDTKLIRYLLKQNHWSCFEHCYVTFLVEAPIPIAVQWLRHLSWKFNMTSRRYTAEQISFYLPRWRAQAIKDKQASAAFIEDEGVLDTINLVISELYKTSEKTYNLLLQMGVAREQARFALCEGLYTKFYATANLRSIIHWHQQRSDEHAQWEIQQYAGCVEKIMSELFPVSWKAYLDKNHNNSI